MALLGLLALSWGGTVAAAPGTDACDWTNSYVGHMTPRFGPGNDNPGARSCVANGSTNVANADDSGIYVGVSGQVDAAGLRGVILGGNGLLLQAPDSVGLPGENGAVDGTGDGAASLLAVDDTGQGSTVSGAAAAQVGGQAWVGQLAVSSIVIHTDNVGCAERGAIDAARVAVLWGGQPSANGCAPVIPAPPSTPLDFKEGRMLLAPDSIEMYSADNTNAGARNAILRSTQVRVGQEYACPYSAPSSIQTADVFDTSVYASTNSYVASGTQAGIMWGALKSRLGGAQGTFPTPPPCPSFTFGAGSGALNSGIFGLGMTSSESYIDAGSDNSVIVQGILKNEIGVPATAGLTTTPAKNSAMFFGGRTQIDADNAVTFACGPLPTPLPYPPLQGHNMGGFASPGSCFINTPALSKNSFVGPVFGPAATGDNTAVILGGASASKSITILAGQANANSFNGIGGSIAQSNSFVGSGNTQLATTNSFVGAGELNQAYGPNSVILGGASAQAVSASVVLGGNNGNMAFGFASTILGGSRGTASGAASTVAGGGANNALGNFGTIGGGDRNQETKDHGTVLGGRYNLADQGATVLGGISNAASGIRALVAGGNRNTASGYAAAVMGGDGAIADVYGQLAQSAVGTRSAGSAQGSLFMLHAQSIGTGAQELFTDGASGRLTLRQGATWAFHAEVTAHLPGATASHSWDVTGLVRRTATGTTLVTSHVTDHTGDPSTASWRITPGVDPNSGSLTFKGNGVPLVRWVASVTTAEVS